MPLDKETLRRLVEKYGPTIDLQGRPETLERILEDLRQAPGGFPAVSDHYKGDTFTKEIDGGTYTKNYVRGYAALPNLAEEDAHLIDDIQLAVDRTLLDSLRQKTKRQP